MLHTIIQKNSYMDSVELMVLSKKLGKFEDVKKATVMMGTAANIEIMKKGGFGSAELAKAQPNDMVIVADTENENSVSAIVAAVKESVNGKKNEAEKAEGLKVIKSWETAKELGDSYNICLISVPGEYAAEEAMEALNMGKHVMLFSDNVSEEEELKLKKKAHEKGLLVMGPDCGTSILSGVPLAFANNIRRGKIGIAGAAGTGIQETAVMIERFGGGISHAIGTGGRDLHEKIGAITMKDAISMLEQDEETTVIVVVSKPPAEAVKEELRMMLASLSKPSAVLFLGENQAKTCGKVHYTGTTAQLAETAVRLSGKEPECFGAAEVIQEGFKKQPKIIGLYSGGTLASEAVCLLKETMTITEEQEKTGYMLYGENCQILDLGDDLYTKGKPHPMMDSGARKEKMLEILEPLTEPAVVLMDVVLGTGSSDNPSEELAETMKLIREKKTDENKILFLVNLLGTGSDKQGMKEQERLLKDAGAYVFFGNTMTIEAALGLAGYNMASHNEKVEEAVTNTSKPERPSESMMKLLTQTPQVINVGLKGFAKDLEDAKEKVVHFEWKPFASGDMNLRKAIEFLNSYEFESGPYKNIDEANQAVIQKMTESLPCLMDVIPAHTVTDVFHGEKLLLHAGPPMNWVDMTHPMQGSCVGAVLFEGWAETEEEAWKMLKKGEVRFMPCHHAGFVGPMGGITSPHMPVLKVKNMIGGNCAYCTMNEGIGQVLRFGAYSNRVIERLRFMRDVLAPTLSKVLGTMENGININVMISRAIAMGDEFHQRNIAASLVFLKEVAPAIVALDIPKDEKYSVVKFLADTDQFFLNVMMAAAKSVMDYAATVECGTVVTVMSRNGKDFGVRISGMGETWYTGPVNIPHGLYFTGFSEEMANPDMGDSAITETFGVGGMSMIAAPAVTRFVGTGGFYDALNISNLMSEICISHNGMFSIPTWNFQGTCLGIDIRKVVATGITPIINTGIAHKVAGQGQIGAGTVNPPLECFTKALMEYAQKLGYQMIEK